MITYETVATAIETVRQYADANAETISGCFFIVAAAMFFLALHKPKKSTPLSHDAIARNAKPGSLIKCEDNYDPQEIEAAIKRVISHQPIIKKPIVTKIISKKPTAIKAAKAKPKKAKRKAAGHGKR